MRKIFRRRFLLLLFILTISSLCFLVFTPMFRDKQDFVSIIDNTETNCPELEKPSSISPTVPPHYLVIPYREFALRTSIACRAFKLDNPKKDSTKFHPKFSTYLRGSFPFIIPHTNITFNDVENFYTKTLIKKKNDSSVIKTSFAQNISFENIPYKFQDGMWYPIGVISAQRTAILVPLQGREYNAKAFLLNMHAFARRQQLTYTILLIEQVSPLGHRFNKGRLYNTGVHYLQQQSLNITCIILHDVDLIPEDDGNLYACDPINPKHTTSRVRQIGSTLGYSRFYEFLIGGVLLLSLDMYTKLNGFSNLFWGWGGEDDDLSLRLLQQRMCVVRPSYELAIYVGLPHPRGQRNNARFGLLTWSTLRLPTDGYAQIEPLTRIVDKRQTSMVTHLKLDVNADRGLYKPLIMEKVASAVNASSILVTTASKTITTTTTRKKS